MSVRDCGASICHYCLNWYVADFGDSEFLGSFYSIVIPVGQAFRPDIVLLAGGEVFM